MDRLEQVLIEFFDLPPTTKQEELCQRSIGRWDSLAMVQLISELQAVFDIEFELDEIEHLTSYDSIKRVLERRGVTVLSVNGEVSQYKGRN
jgi:acyl carrier protein